MKAHAVVFSAKNIVDFQEVEIPLPGDEGVVIDVEFSWISVGTEQSFLTGERISGEQAARPNDSLPFPQVAGYQKVGIVREVGKAVTGIEVGMRVFASISKVNGMAFDYGGHINPAVTHYSQVWILPDEGQELLAYSPLVLAQVGFNCGTRPAFKAGEQAFVIGDGLVGHWAAQTLRSRGAQVTMLGRRDERLALLPNEIRGFNVKKGSLESLLEEFNGSQKIQVVVDSIGSLSTFEALRPHMKRNSHLVSAGFLGENGKVDIQQLRAQEITLHCPSGWTTERMNDTLEAIADGRLKTIPLITHFFPACKSTEAWQMIRNNSEPFLGVVLDWRASVD